MIVFLYVTQFDMSKKDREPETGPAGEDTNDDHMNDQVTHADSRKPIETAIMEALKDETSPQSPGQKTERSVPTKTTDQRKKDVESGTHEERHTRDEEQGIARKDLLESSESATNGEEAIKSVQDALKARSPALQRFDAISSKKNTPPPTEYISEQTNAELSEILSTTIKGDRINALVLYFSTLLNYTNEDQQNLAFTAPSSTGKSYLALQIVGYFPEEDVEKHDYASPKSFFWDRGELVDAENGLILIPRDQFIQDRVEFWAKENPKPSPRSGLGEWRDSRDQVRREAIQEYEDIPKVYKIILTKKIMVFKDQPNAELLAMLRPLLSHDEREMRNKIVDRGEGGGHKTKHIWVIGYPTCIFSTAKFIQSEQEQTRLFILSPEIEQDKFRNAIKLLGKRLGNRPKFKDMLEADEARQGQKARVRAIKDAEIKEIIIPPEFVERVVSRFLREHQNLSPRHMRDFPRLIALIKAHALNNVYTREGEAGKLYATEHDVNEGYNLYNEIAESNELGLPPIVYKFYMEKLKPVLDLGEFMLRSEEARLYHEMYKIMVSDKKLKEINSLLSAVGLLVETVSPDDKRFKVIYSPRGGVEKIGDKRENDNPVETSLDDLAILPETT